MIKTQRSWLFLGYLGLIPFISCLWLIEYPTIQTWFSPQQGFIFYSGIILSFLAGALWRKSASTTLLIISNTLCIYAFICLLLSPIYALLFLPFGYFALLIVEYVWRYQKMERQTDSYFTMRTILTLSVISFHILALLQWL